MQTLVPIGTFEDKARDLLGDAGFDDRFLLHIRNEVEHQHPFSAEDANIVIQRVACIFHVAFRLSSRFADSVYFRFLKLRQIHHARLL